MGKLTPEDVIEALNAVKPATAEDGITFIHGLQSALYATVEALNEKLCPESHKLPPGTSAEGIDDTSRKVILIHWLSGATWLTTPWSPSTESMNFKLFFSSMLAVYWRRLAYGNDFDTPNAGIDRTAEIVYFASQAVSLLVAAGNGFSTEQCDSLSGKLAENMARAINDTVVEFRKTTSHNPEWN